MAGSLNHVQIIGHLGHDPSIRYMPNGDATAQFSVATSQRWKDKASGEMKESTEWHRCVAYRRTAEVAGEYLKKGSYVYASGRLQTRKWTDKEGVERYTTEIIVDQIQMLDKLGGGEQQPGEQPQQQQRPANNAAQYAAAKGKPAPARAHAGGGFDNMDDDIPF